MTKLKDAQDKVRELSQKALAVAENTDGTYKSFADQKAALDPLEADIKKWTTEVQELEYIDGARKRFAGAGGSLDDASSEDRKSAVAESIGHQFVNSQGYKSLIERGLKGNWTTSDVEVKAPLLQGTAGAPAGGYQVTNQPAVQAGVVEQRFRTLTISDLFPGGTTTSPLIRYLVESVVTNGAAAVPEGGVKPESTLAFTKVDEVLHKIATFLPISDEMLEDWAQARSYIDARLILFVKLAEEAQLLSGDGTGANLVGLLNRPGLATPIARGAAPSAADDNAMDAIYRQITRIRTTQFLEPDAVVIDPLGWEGIALSKNAQGAYYSQGPFVTEATPSLWGKRVVSTPAIAASTALVGAFAQGGQIFRKGGITVEASNSHADYFQKNLTALRAEERLALAVYRPGAFGLVTALNG
ncbi:phage major capsid protein [Rathayibacter sp. Leaf248]|uniref:phage major capsid protein n=1 Tax=Rathayibacter sp. Leaf248 TaxID=2876555 RepID=UPI001E4B1596|nr:phage major capsid protein [Rathayibacter sp. Leaf248]